MIVQLDDEDDEENENVLEVSIHNAESLSAFMACSTQWRTVGTKQGVLWIGLDYAACKVMVDARGFSTNVLTDFPAIEDKVLPLFNEADVAAVDEDEDDR